MKSKEEYPIENFCSKFLLMAEPETSLLDIQLMMEDVSVRHIPIIRDDVAIGIISKRDLETFKDQSYAKKYTAEDIMIPNPFSVKIGTPLGEVIREMYKNKFGSVLVKNEEGKIIGIFTSIDALRALELFLLRSKEVH